MFRFANVTMRGAVPVHQGLSVFSVVVLLTGDSRQAVREPDRAP
jgi:hypothetical protein